MKFVKIKKHFQQWEFLSSATIPENYEPNIVESSVINGWILKLSLIRQLVGFPISVTDGLRLFTGEDSRSQHFYGQQWSKNGAVDIRPSDKTNSEQFMQLGLVLAAHPYITRVCYYTPSERFPNGGFHCDCKGMEKKLFINEGADINWQLVDDASFISRIQGHSVDIKAGK